MQKQVKKINGDDFIKIRIKKQCPEGRFCRLPLCNLLTKLRNLLKCVYMQKKNKRYYTTTYSNACAMFQTYFKVLILCEKFLAQHFSNSVPMCQFIYLYFLHLSFQLYNLLNNYIVLLIL